MKGITGTVNYAVYIYVKLQKLQIFFKFFLIPSMEATLVHKWHGTLNQHSSFDFGAMHQLWYTGSLGDNILTLLLGYPDIHFLV